MVRIISIPELFERIKRLIHFVVVTALYHRLHFHWMRAVDNAENIVSADEAKAGVGALKIVDGLTHITFGREYERSNAIVTVFYALRLANLIYAFHDLAVGEARVTQDGASRL